MKLKVKFTQFWMFYSNCTLNDETKISIQWKLLFSDEKRAKILAQNISIRFCVSDGNERSYSK